MKRVLTSVFVVALTLGVGVTSVEAARLGGGRTTGIKRQAPPPQPQQTVPAQQGAAPAQSIAPNQAASPQPGAGMAAPAGATAAAAAVAPKRSWLGPVAGLAAGLGIAALFSHLGLGAGLANFVMLLLLALVAVVAIRFVMRRMSGGGPRLAGAGAPADLARYSNGLGAGPGLDRSSEPLIRREPLVTPSTEPAVAPSAATPFVAPVSSGHVPADFDAAGFERIAKLLFLRLQAANDAGDLADLRRYTTPEMYAEFQLDVQQRPAGSAQHTDVMQFEARVVEVAEDAGQRIVSVRFDGLIREAREGAASAFDEVWHFVQPTDGSRDDWRIAGITQAETTA